jgi:hypothetical protein
MNPLQIPFGNKPKAEEKPKVPTFIGVRNEAVRDSADAPMKIKIQVIGVKGLQNTTYELAYRPGAPIKEYLDRIKLRHAATYAAVRDQSNLSHGRLRMYYVPTEKSHITLGNPKVSSALQFQRSSVDAQEVAYRMGSKSGGSSPKVVESKRFR